MRYLHRRGARVATLPLFLVLVLGACGDGGGSSASISHPDGDALVFRIENSGGFVTPDFLFGSLPVFTLVGDGRVIVPGAQDAIFPGPALPPVMERTLSEDGIQAVLRLVAATGQFAASTEWRGAGNVVADAADTVFTLHADGREVTVTVYALGIPTPDVGAVAVSAGELAAHRVLSGLVAQLGEPEVQVPGATWTDDWHPYQPTALRLLVRNLDDVRPDPSGLPATELPWPTAGDPARFGTALAFDPASRCGAVTGDDAHAWLAALAGANQLTRWTAGTRSYAVTVRPLLPDEPPACAQGA